MISSPYRKHIKKFAFYNRGESPLSATSSSTNTSTTKSNNTSSSSSATVTGLEEHMQRTPPPSVGRLTLSDIDYMEIPVQIFKEQKRGGDDATEEVGKNAEFVSKATMSPSAKLQLQLIHPNLVTDT